MENKITVAIPSYNNEKHIGEAIKSVLMQEYPLKEIIIYDDASTDDTVLEANFTLFDKHLRSVRVNEKNLGIGKNLEKLMQECKTKYIIYLCADDKFTHPKVLTDIVHIFDANPDIGIIGRYFYFFMDGYEGAIGVCRDKNILTNSCCPSGMAYRRQDNIKSTNRIFIEMPTIVAQYLKQYRWTMLEYDTIAARFHPGGNTGTKRSYYTQSPTQNWMDLTGEDFTDFPMFVQLKNRAPKLLWKEIWLHAKNKKNLLKSEFWVFAIIAVITPSFILRRLSNFYRHRITRRKAVIIERPNNA